MLDQILDATARLTSKRRSVADLEDLGITCWRSDPGAAKVMAEFIAEFGAGQRKLGPAAGVDDSNSSKGDTSMENSHAEFSAAQLKADFCYRAFGDRAPPPMQGESAYDYRARLASKYQQYSKTFKDAKLADIGCAHTLGALEDEIFKDAVAALHCGGTAAPGQLVPITRLDAAGRPITRYVASDDGACWNLFNAPYRLVTKWRQRDGSWV